MKWLALCLLPLTLSAGQARYARVSDFDGAVEVQLQAADDWQAARRNLPLRELSWVRTDGPARIEVELDDGNVLRLGPDSLAELSDYTRLSSGQRITVISLDHGVAYFTGAAEAADTVILAVPGAQASVHQGARLRLEARDPWSLVATADGAARFSSPSAEFDLAAGQIVKIDAAHAARFYLYREIPQLETDHWSEERDRVLASTTSSAHVPGLRYGLADLDAYGVWIQTADFGAVWRPKAAAAAWAPFRNGKWTWYDGLGYTWISDDPWGWLPYHYGRWMQEEGTGWVWTPGDGSVFLPGEVYWLKSAKLVGWGALAPGENWKPPEMPRLFLNVNTTYATYTPDAHEIDPAGFSARPKEPLATAAFVEALPSPAFPAARLSAFRQPLRAGTGTAVPVSSGVAFGGQSDPPPAAQQPPPATAPMDTSYTPPAQAPVMIVNAPPVEVPVEVDVPVPVYLGIIVVNPPGYKAPVTTPPAQKPPKSVPPAAGSPTTPPQKPKTPDPEKPVK